MDRGHSDTQGVHLGVCGQWHVCEQGVRQVLDGVGDIQLGQVCEYS
jgi:hypothetical protein